MKTEKKEEVNEPNSAQSKKKKSSAKKEASSQLYERRWSVVNFKACVASGLTYDEAVLEMKKHAQNKASGLCIVTDEAAARIK